MDIKFARQEYGWCRSLAHSWTASSPLERDENDLLTLEVECDRCSGTRRDIIDFRTGQLLQRVYRHAQGYLFHFGKDNRPSKADIRSAFFHELLGEKMPRGRKKVAAATVAKRKPGRPRKIRVKEEVA